MTTQGVTGSSLKPLSALFEHLNALDESRKILGIVFDVDDTITTRGLLDKEAFDALHALSLQGLKLIANSGRPLGFGQPLVRMLPIDAYVGENGAGYISTRAPSHCQFRFDKALPQDHLNALQRLREKILKHFPKVVWANDQPARFTDLAIDINETAHMPEHDIQRLVQLAEELQAPWKRSSIHFHFSIFPSQASVNKVSGAVLALREIFELDDNDIFSKFIYIGDSNNDTECFHAFNHSVGVSNLMEHKHALSVLPQYLCSKDRGRGFAELASHWIKP